MAVAGFTLGNAVAVIGVIVAFHNKILTAAFAFTHSDIGLQQLYQFKLNLLFNTFANTGFVSKKMDFMLLTLKITQTI